MELHKKTPVVEQVKPERSQGGSPVLSDLSSLVSRSRFDQLISLVPILCLESFLSLVLIDVCRSAHVAHDSLRSGLFGCRADEAPTKAEL
jgi:hypothetical protein